VRKVRLGKRYDWALLAVEAAATVILGFGTNPHLRREFFTTVSEILPVLLLAVVVDLRRTRTADERHTLGYLLLLFSFVLGEAVAIAISANRRDVITSSWWLAFVIASLVALSGLVLISSLRETSAGDA
jgi:hypothetical protein